MNDHTNLIDVVKTGSDNSAEEIIKHVYEALKEKGYDPETQIAGYFLTGDPTYITSHKRARSLVRKIDRYEFMTEVIRFYLQNKHD